jgi:hypothetical protein
MLACFVGCADRLRLWPIGFERYTIPAEQIAQRKVVILNR